MRNGRKLGVIRVIFVDFRSKTRYPYNIVDLNAQVVKSINEHSRNANQFDNLKSVSYTHLTLPTKA